jgi:hypothetical protein
VRWTAGGWRRLSSAALNLHPEEEHPMSRTASFRGRALLLAAATACCCIAGPAFAENAQPRGSAPFPAIIQPAQAPAATVDATTDINFPPTPVGSTATATCASECFTQTGGPPNNCDGSGTISIDKALAMPFQVGNFRITSGTGCTGTPTTMPAHLNSGERLVFDFSFSPTTNGTFMDTLGLGGVTWTLTGSTPSSTTCTADSQTLCLENGRFKVTAAWQTNTGASGNAQVVPLTADTGYLWFFNSVNVEVVIKVLDACAVNSKFWVFAGGLTNVKVTIQVVDTQTGATNTYINPQNTAFQPLQDTSAFACP